MTSRQPSDGPILTRAEDLLFQVAIARHRLEDTPYLIEARHRPTARSLEAKGLIWTDWGNVEKTIKIGLTTLGEIVGISETHTPPALRTACRSFYFGPKSVTRIDCDKRRGHSGKHRHEFGFARNGETEPWVVKWTDAQAGGYDDPFWEPRLREMDATAAAERATWRTAVAEGRIDWATGQIQVGR